MLKSITFLMLLPYLVGLVYAQTPLTPPTVIAYADRTVYRPGETVVITVEALDDELKHTPGKSIIITVTNPNQETLLDNAVRTGENGVATITLTLDDDSPEGEYLIEAVDEENIYTSAAAFFLVCSSCQPTQERPAEFISTTTATISTTLTTTQTTTRQLTNIITEEILTRETLLTAILAVITAIFAIQIIVIRRMTRAASGQTTSSTPPGSQGATSTHQNATTAET